MCALSGGVDSTVAATLIHRAIGDQLQCIFVDNGLLRLNEAQQVVERYKKLQLPVHFVDASDTFLTRLTDVIDPEQKRKIIGATFIDVFEEEARTLGHFDFLAQGTLYPDVIESVSVRGPSATIKSHHNVGGLPERMRFKLVEPLRELFKDEVRAVGRDLGHRSGVPHPPAVSRARPRGAPARRADARPARPAARADAIVAEEMRRSGWYERLWQSFAVLLPVQSVGVMGDARTYEFTVAIRAVESLDGMTADWARLPHDLLATISSRIVNEVKGINRVVYDISSKPPSTIEWEVAMSRCQFVHLHLHTEYSLLDGACRIEELLDQAAKLEMPALAVTEHGNMFSSVVFHDAARKRGIKPILGCEVYVAPGSRLDKSGTIGETANHLVLLAETNEGYQEPHQAGVGGLHRGLLLQAAHRQGSARRAQQGPDRPQQLPERRSRQRDPRRAGAQGAWPPRPRYRDILGDGNFFLEMQFQGIDEQRIVNTGLLPIARDLNLPLVCTNDVHYLRQDDSQAARHPALHRHRQVGATTRSVCAITAISSS